MSILSAPANANALAITGIQAALPTYIARFSTVASLRTIGFATLASNAAVSMLGFATPGDGGGGDFYWNATSSAIDDGALVINPTGNSGAGRLLRRFTGVVDIRWYGAVGDGATVANTAFTSACASGYPVLIAGGTYKLTLGYTVITASLMFQPGGMLDISSANLHLSGTLYAGQHQIFVGSAPLFYSNGAVTQSGLVEWWGGAGDGVVTGATITGTDNFPAINAAIASGIRELIFSGSTYRITQTISTSRAGLSVRGLESNATSLYLDDSTGLLDVWHATKGAGALRFDKMRFDRVQACTTGAALRLTDVYDVRVNDCFLGSANCVNGLLTEAVANSVTRVYLLNSYISYTTGDGVLFTAQNVSYGLGDCGVGEFTYINFCGGAAIKALGNCTGVIIEGGFNFHNAYGFYFDGTGFGNASSAHKIRQTASDTNTNGNLFLNVGTMVYNGNWHSNQPATVLTTCAGWVIADHDFQGAALILNGCVGMKVSGYVSSSTPTPVQVNPSGSTGCSDIELDLVYAFGTAGTAIVNFGAGTPIADRVTIRAQLSAAAGPLTSGLCTNLTAQAGDRGTLLAGALGVIGTVSSSSGFIGGGLLGAVSITADGYGATTNPTIIVPAPSLPSGQQATVSGIVYYPNVLTLTGGSGGTGYVVGDTPSFVGSPNAGITVTSIGSGGVITGFNRHGGSFTSVTNGSTAVALTGGSGTGASLVPSSFGISSITLAGGSGYVGAQSLSVAAGSGLTAFAAIAYIATDTTFASGSATTNLGTGGNPSHIVLSDATGVTVGSSGDKLGFGGVAPIAKPTISGSAGTATAATIQSIAAALASLGLVSNGVTS